MNKGWLLVFGGVCLLVPSVMHLLDRHALSDSDASIALQPIKRIPLDGAHFDFILQIPYEGPWRRIWRSWGNPGYVIAVEHNGSLECTNDIVTSLRIEASGKTIDTSQPNDPIYGYALKCQHYGYLLRAPPKTIFHVTGILANGTSENKNVIVTPYWTSRTKDRLAGIALWTKLAVPFSMCAIMGGLLIGAGIHCLGH